MEGKTDEGNEGKGREEKEKKGTEWSGGGTPVCVLKFSLEQPMNRCVLMVWCRSSDRQTDRENSHR